MTHNSQLNYFLLVILQSAELEAILAPIRLAQEQEAYATMLSSSPNNYAQGGNTFKDPFDLKTTDNWDFRSASHPQLSVKQEWEAVRRELSAVVNVIASMGAVATAVWWATGTAPLVQVRGIFLVAVYSSSLTY